jgi:acyl carrier protein
MTLIAHGRARQCPMRPAAQYTKLLVVTSRSEAIRHPVIRPICWFPTTRLYTWSPVIMDTDQNTPHSESNSTLSLTERGLAALWLEVLPATEALTATDNFFALGGDSMSMVMIEYRIKEEFSIELPPGALLGAPTLRELAALVEASGGSRHASLL